MARTSPTSSSASEVITAIEPLSRDPNLRRIKVNGRVIATLRASELEELALTVDQKWTARTASSVERCLDLRRAREKALRYLGTRSHSQKELRGKLIDRDIQPSIADGVIADLADQGWLDDRSHARSAAESILRSGPMSVGYLKSKLLAKKIELPLAQQVAQEVLSEMGDLVGEACAYATRRLIRRDADSRSNARRVAAWLGRRGFEDDDIHAVLERLDLLTEQTPDD